MARIRTIKPEFPQSESMGRVSRDARLLFIMIWTLCDDTGKTRAASRMLASLLYPYDDDAPKLIDGWLSELEAEDCIRLYECGGTRYLEVCKWLSHQKIDHASKSKFPEFSESSRVLASPREASWEDQGPRTKDQGPVSEDQGPKTYAPPKIGESPREKVTKPPLTAEETAFKTLCKTTWEAYADAYRQRYSVDPIRNAKVNAQVVQFCKRIGNEAPEAAGWFVGHQAQWYVTKGHSIDCLLADAEKLRTEWATGRRTTATQARQADKSASNVFVRLLEEERERSNSKGAVGNC